MPKKKLSFSTYMLNKLKKHTIDHPSVFQRSSRLISFPFSRHLQQKFITALTSITSDFVTHVDSGEMRRFITGLHTHYGYSQVNLLLFAKFVPGLVRSQGQQIDLQEFHHMWPAIVKAIPDPRSQNPLKRKAWQAFLSEVRPTAMDVSSV